MNSRVFLHRLILIFCLILGQQNSFAEMVDCTQNNRDFFHKTVCQNTELHQMSRGIQEKYLNTQLMSNAPLLLLQVAQQGWENYVRQCTSKHCIKTQFEQRMDELTFLTSMNQSLTQHYMRFKNAKIDRQTTHLQLQQLDKNRIKIEGLQYRNPNHQDRNRIAYLRAYTSPQDINEITDLESKCIYQLKRSALTVQLQSKNKHCQRFDGIYRLYD
ncbi:MAG: hypothetical protein E6Q25_05915 [Acinetobacter sp.]|jgi:uncharacterized protein|nr:MAG: hypothetical protein E6Q25_05915 [Acinetobacter sp.]